MDKMGFSMCLLLVLLTAQLGWSRPQQQRGKLREVRLITEPRPGQEFVHIQSSVISQQKVGPEVDFATSHKIPRPLPVDEPDDEDEVEVAPVKTPVKTRVRVPVRVQAKAKRESDPEDLDEVILSPAELVPLVEEVKKKEEIRMEFSVVTSKPRKEMKPSGVSKKVSPSPASDSKEAASTPEVEVDSKGEFGQLEAIPSGADEKKVLSAKKQPSSVKQAATKVQEQLVKEVEVKPASQVGVTSPKVEQESGAITVPIQKQHNDGSAVLATTTPLTPSASESYDILPVNHITAKREDADTEKDFDFVDSPLADKVLVPAGTNQQSRIEVKKGPNGQDYEYEYVYYYYDDDENDTTADSGDKKANSVKTSPTVTTTTSAPSTTSSRHYLPESPAQEVEPTRSRGRVRGQASIAADLEQTAVAPQDAVNEVVPARGGSHSRTRGRSGTTEESSTLPAEERLPANTRFPPRSRSSHNSNSVATTTPLPTPIAQDTPITRVRGGNSVRRPSLELVDSSSFKTHSSDASRDQDLRPEFPSRLPEGPARFLGVAANEEDEPIKPRGNRVRGPSSTTPAPVEEDVDEEEEDEDISDAPRRGQPIRRPASSAKTAAEDVGVLDTTTSRVAEVGLTAAQMDIVANELYSLLQQAQAENAIGEEATPLGVAAVDEEEVTTELEEVTTTPAPTTPPPTTTTTTAATTTSTTTQEPPTTAGGRGRYRGNAGAARTGTRNKFRANAASAEARTTTTEAAPVESSTRARGRFGSNANSRAPSSSNFGGRKTFHKSTSPPEDHSGDSEQEVAAVSVAPATRSGGFPRNRFSATRPARLTSTTSTPPSDDSPPSSPSSPAAKPAYADRFNSLRRRGGAKASTTAAPAADEQRSESSGEETNEPATASEAPSTTPRSQGRQRLSIGSGARPLRPGPKVNIGNRGRIGVSTTTQQPSTEADDSEQTLSSSSSAQEDAQSQSDEAPEVVTTAAPDALTRLRNRPRLRVNAAAKQPAASTSSPVRRPHGLLPRRRPQPAEVKEASESDSSNPSEDSESSSPSSEETSEASTEGTSSATHEPAHENRLSSLLRRRSRPSRPSFPRQNNQDDA